MNDRHDPDFPRYLLPFTIDANWYDAYWYGGGPVLRGPGLLARLKLWLRRRRAAADHGEVPLDLAAREAPGD